MGKSTIELWRKIHHYQIVPTPTGTKALCMSSTGMLEITLTSYSYHSPCQCPPAKPVSFYTLLSSNLNPVTSSTSFPIITESLIACLAGL